MSLAGSAPLQSGQSVQQAPIPTLAAPFDPVPKDDSIAADDEAADGEHLSPDDKKKGKKRGFFGLGKKKDEPAAHPSQSSTPQQQQQQLSSKLASKPLPPAPLEKDSLPVRKTTSPIQTDAPYTMPSSPGRGRGTFSSSPRLASPAGSQIFERDVQESAVMPNSPAIPSHITTENYIPPVLDASSEAITDDHLDPDSVEIITHTGHQPAAVTVTGVPPAPSASSQYESLAASWAEELASFADAKDGGLSSADNASNYGSFDTTDVRRLSFISFADVVQAEQTSHPAGAAGSRDSMHLAGLTSLHSMGRSPSPIRSPVSSQGPGTSPPTSKSGSVKGVELSPSRKPIGSPVSAHHPVTTGELNIETMSQALRRTSSRDLSGVRSLPTSPVEGPSR